jgi:hypothetical protein
MKFIKKLWPVLLVLLVAFILVFSFAVYKLRSSEIKDLISSQIEQLLPSTTVGIESLEYDIFPSIKTHLKNLLITSSRKNQIVKIENLEIILPLWVMIFDRGTVDVKLSHLNVSIDELNEVLKNKVATQEELPKKEKEENSDNQEVPSFIKKSKLNFEISNSLISYKDKNNSEAQIKIEKIELKNAGFEKEFQYEMMTTLKIKTKDKELNPSLKILGKTNLSDFLRRGEFKNVSTFDLSHINFEHQSFPDIHGELKLDHKSKEINSMDIEAKFGNSTLLLESDINLSTNQFVFKKLSSKIDVNSVIKMIPTLKDKILVNKDFVADFVGHGVFSKEKIEGDFIASTNSSMKYKLKEGSYVDFKSLKSKINFQGKKYDDLKSSFEMSFSQSTFKATAAIDHGNIVINNILGSLAYNDLVSFFPSDYEDYRKIQKSQIGSFNLAGDIKVEKDKKIINLKLSNTNDFEILGTEGNFLKLIKTNTSIVFAKEIEEVEKIDSTTNFKIKLQDQPETFANAQLTGQFNLNDFLNNDHVKGSFKLQGSTQKKIKEKFINSSSVGLSVLLEKEKMKISDLLGNINLKEAMAFVPLQKIKQIKKIEVGNSFATFSGAINIENKKIFNPSFDFTLSEPVKIFLNAGVLSLRKIKFGVNKFDELMNIGFLGESDISITPNHFNKEIALNSKISGSLKGREYTENKKINAQINFIGKTQLSQLKASIDYKNDEILINEINTMFNIAEIKALAPNQYADSLKMLDPNHSKLTLSGNVHFDKEKLIKSNLKMNILTPLVLKLPNNIQMKMTLDGLMNDKGISILSKANVFNGEVVTSLISKKITMFKDINLKSLFPEEIKINANNIHLENEFIKKFIYGNSTTVSKSDKVQPPESLDTNKSENSILKELPPFLIQLNVNNLTVGMESFYSKGTIKFKNETFEANNLLFKLAKGYASMNFTASLKNHESHRKLSAKIANFNLSALNGILPPLLERVSGNFSGQIDGNMILKNKILSSYDMNYSLKIADGELKKINLTEYIKKTIEKIDFTKEFGKKLNLKLTDQFEKLELVGSANQQNVQMTKFDFVGLKNSSSIIGSGQVFQLGTKGQSVVNLEYKDLTGQISQFLKTNTGSDVIPLKLKGIEFDLLPDYAFTLKQVGGNALKTQSTQLVKKATEKVKEKIGEKTNDLINSFFKKKN